VKGAVIVSAGGKEIGQKGREIESKIKEEAVRAGIRIIGPNCVGVICTHSKLYATFADRMPLTGNMAFISQSGALIGAILDFALKKQIGFSHFISVGSMLDADFGDLLDYLGNDPQVDSIVIYMEGVDASSKIYERRQGGFTDQTHYRPQVRPKCGRGKGRRLSYRLHGR
jgi:acetyltransferase